ncbi:DUF1102 domain-containing protein [Halorubrum vacuolatum]|uniref:Uncharacterized protein n=1 Tax=Halorubrum vacuolatum TaxID=63740 RepID=A0A238X967_HALVU|nr:DUF1102 domain-containing protein [Halorubrum vacuolatum]SNR55101.1 Protein of unknown function [Halorubrum vacuolatum]
MQRRNFLVGIGSASVGGSALLGTGAFSRVESQRNVTIAVAEDPDAYLGLDKCPTPNGSYVHPDEKGHMELLMNPDNPTIGDTPLGSGINSNSRSQFDNVFQICNQGKETICVHIEDDESWPTVPEGVGGDVGERRVEFYLGDTPGVSVVGIENAFPLAVGECVCIGILTRSHGLVEGDELLDALDNEIRIIADVDGDCVPETCPDLSVAYECTTYVDEGDNFRRTGTRFRVTNNGPVATTYDLAVANEPGDWRSGLSVGANSSTTPVADASVPTTALVFWTCANGEPAGAQTWGEYKEENEFDDLEDWYEQVGSVSLVPSGAPSDVNDDLLVAEATNIPDDEPDEDIDAADFPDMSQEAEDDGWIACVKFDDQN